MGRATKNVIYTKLKKPKYVAKVKAKATKKRTGK